MTFSWIWRMLKMRSFLLEPPARTSRAIRVRIPKNRRIVPTIPDSRVASIIRGDCHACLLYTSHNFSRHSSSTDWRDAVPAKLVLTKRSPQR